jgi:hypothetical protein
MSKAQKANASGATEAFAEQKKTDSAAVFSRPEADGNNATTLSKLKSACAVAGFLVHEIPDGCGFFVARPVRNSLRYCRDLDDLHAFARMVGVS